MLQGIVLLASARGLYLARHLPTLYNMILENTYFAKIVLCVQFTNGEERYKIFIKTYWRLDLFCKERERCIIFMRYWRTPGCRWKTSVDQGYRFEGFHFQIGFVSPHICLMHHMQVEAPGSPHPIDMSENISDLLSCYLQHVPIIPPLYLQY